MAHGRPAFATLREVTHSHIVSCGLTSSSQIAREQDHASKGLKMPVPRPGAVLAKDYTPIDDGTQVPKTHQTGLSQNGWPLTAGGSLGRLPSVFIEKLHSKFPPGLPSNKRGRSRTAVISIKGPVHFHVASAVDSDVN